MPDFSLSEQNFSEFFYCFVFSGNAAPADENSRTKFSRQTEKASANFWGAKTRGAHFSSGRALASGASRPTPLAALLFIPATQSFASQLPSSRLGRPTPYTSPTSTSNPIISTFFFLFFIANILPAISTILPFFHFQSLTPTSSPPPSPTPPPPYCCRFPTRRPNAKRSFARGCSLQGCRWCGRGARVSFFFFLFLFFSASLFSLSFLISLAPRLRRDAFIFLFIFSFYFFLSFCFCSYFCSYFCFFLFAFLFAFSFCFFLSIFILIFYSCFFVLSFCFFFLFTFALIFVFLFFIFIFTFIFAFFVFSLCFFFLVFIFDSPFLFCLSFCFTFLPSSLQSLSSLSNRSPAIHFFSSAANLSHSIQPLQQQQKEEKISAKESTGVRWPPGSERAAGGKAEGRNGMK